MTNHSSPENAAMDDMRDPEVASALRAEQAGQPPSPATELEAVTQAIWQAHKDNLHLRMTDVYRVMGVAAVEAMRANAQRQLSEEGRKVTDIVERLREWPHGHKTMIVSEAIDEIERLRGELERARGLLTLVLHTEAISSTDSGDKND